jgi:hypothetical protein
MMRNVYIYIYIYIYIYGIKNMQVVSEGRREETWHCEDWKYEELGEVMGSGYRKK